MQVMRARESDQPITHVFALHENENDEDNDDARRGERFEDGLDDGLHHLERVVRLMHFDRDRFHGL